MGGPKGWPKDQPIFIEGEPVSSIVTPNRYNSFIIDSFDPMKKVTYYSCPKCYVNTGGNAGVATVTCRSCQFTGGVIANPAPAPTLGGAIKLKGFIIESIGSQWVIRCSNCNYHQYANPQVLSATCANCVQSGVVFYVAHCSACLINKNKLEPAVYICSSPGTNHTTAFDKNLAQAGKCFAHHCSKTCVKL